MRAKAYPIFYRDGFVLFCPVPVQPLKTGIDAKDPKETRRDELHHHWYITGYPWCARLRNLASFLTNEWMQGKEDKGSAILPNKKGEPGPVLIKPGWAFGGESKGKEKDEEPSILDWMVLNSNTKDFSIVAMKAIETSANHFPVQSGENTQGGPFIHDAASDTTTSSSWINLAGGRPVPGAAYHIPNLMRRCTFPNSPGTGLGVINK